MFYYTESELAEVIERMRQDTSRYSWHWYREVMLQAQERGFLKIIGHSEDNPFWWRNFVDSIEISDKLKEIIEKNRLRDLK